MSSNEISAYISELQTQRDHHNKTSQSYFLLTGEMADRYHALGLAYETEQNPEMAIFAFQMAVRLANYEPSLKKLKPGHKVDSKEIKYFPHTMYEQALKYEAGNNRARAATFFKYAAFLKHPEALCRVGGIAILDSLAQNDPKIRKMATGLFIDALKQGNLRALINVGELFAQGWGVAQNPVLALSCYRDGIISAKKESAHQVFCDALNYIGDQYDTGTLPYSDTIPAIKPTRSRHHAS